MKINNSYPGLYIVFEGIVGTGKSTQIKLLCDNLKTYSDDISTRLVFEPGGTSLADQIRKIVKYEKLTAEEEARLFAKARESLLDEVVRPALARGELVISDRSFLSSLAYQGEGRLWDGGGQPLYKGWRGIWKQFNKEVLRETMPDVIMFIDTSIAAARERSERDNPDKFDREGSGFWERTREGYLDVLFRLTCQYTGMSIIKIDDDGRLGKDEISRHVVREVAPLIDSWLANGEGRVHRERQISSKERLVGV